MILLDMDYPAVFRQIYAESEKVNYYLQKNLKDVLYEKRGKYIGPNSYYDLVTMKDSNNRYLLYWHITDIEDLYKNGFRTAEKNILYGPVLLLNDKDGKLHAISYKRYKMFLDNQLIWMDCLYTYTPHFFSRYKERYGLPKEMTNIDVIGYFSNRNLNFMRQLDYNEISLPKNRIENGTAFSLIDGVSLAEITHQVIDDKPVMIVNNRTFLSKDILKENQAKQVPTKEENIEWARKAFKQHFGYEFKES